MIKKLVLFIMACMLIFPLSIAQDKKTKATKAKTTAKGVDLTSPFITEEELGLRKYNLYSEEDVNEYLSKYSMMPPATSTRIERAFENAPPMIPHMVKGFLPIRAKNNICITCHMPAMAVALKSTAIPKSHLSSFRPELVEENGKFRVDAKEGEVIITDLAGKLNPARFNCTQCHAPQAQITVNLENIFKADFLTDEGRTRSNFIDVIKEGVK